MANRSVSIDGLPSGHGGNPAYVPAGDPAPEWPNYGDPGDDAGPSAFGAGQLNASSVNGTVSPSVNSTPCLNDYCVSIEDYLAMIEAYIFPTHFEWVLIALYIIAFMVGLSGNFLVCFAVWRNQQMRTVTNLFIVNLAVADFLVILVCLPPTVLGDVTETWYMGSVMCKIVQYLQGVSVSVSVLTLSVISIERWYAICHPLKFKSTITRARAMILIIWFVGMAMLVPELVVLDTYRHPKLPPELTYLLTSCRPNWGYDSQATYEFFKMVALYIVPLCLMAVTYGHIVRCLWSNVIPIENYTSSSRLRSPGGRSAAEHQLTSRRKAAKMLIAVVLMFAICYLPVHLLNILRYAKVLPDSQWTTNFALIAHYMCYFNSAINPVIYNFMSAKFRKEFRKACSCCTRLCCPVVRTRRPGYGESMYSYKYTNDISQTEQISLTTMRHNIGNAKMDPVNL